MKMNTLFSILFFLGSCFLLQAQGYEEDVNRLSTRERIYFGGGLTGLSIGSIGSGSTSFSIGLGPQLGYLLTNSSVVGLGANYQYNSFGSSSISLLGGSVFAKQYLPVFNERIGELYLHFQIDKYSAISNVSFGQKYSTPILLGIGRGSRIGPNISILYDLNYSVGDLSPHGRALVVQLGGLFF
ncbi:hypothetical protein U0R10_00115 [Aquirufa sp. OSTEICH-129V]|uniref:Outer membrane protein beta-barrel domain-containing protein n=1 Tax=Aquirufa avitistagni TaxID=3104728 RepID=A0ABW6D7W1_9BACT